MNIKLETNLKKTMRDVSTLENVKRAAAAETLKNTARFAKRDGSKFIRNTRYSTMPGKVILQSIAVKDERLVPSQAVDRMSSQTGFFGRSVAVRYMKPRNVEVRTRKGRRWGVAVKSGAGKSGLTGAFHLKRHGRDWYSGRYSDFDERSQIFKSQKGSKKLVPYRFKNMGEIMRDTGIVPVLVREANHYMAKQMARNFKRYLYQYDVARKSGGL